MSEEQVAFHEKYIKGINTRMLLIALGFVITFVYYGTQFIDRQAVQGDQLQRVITQLDTLSARQMRNDYGYRLRFHDLEHKLGDK